MTEKDNITIKFCMFKFNRVSNFLLKKKLSLHFWTKF